MVFFLWQFLEMYVLPLYLSCDVLAATDHDVKLLGLRDELHGGVVHDHLVELNVGVEGGHVLAALKEQAVAELHDVCLVYSGDLNANNKICYFVHMISDSTFFLPFLVA